jgi:hypothetical protein
MRKALKVATLMGLAAALIVPATPSKAADMDMGSTKVTIGGQLRERLEWYANEVGSGTGKEVGGTYRARIKIKAQLSDGVTAVFVPQAVGVWGENKQGVGLDTNGNAVFDIHEAYMLLSNPFGINNVIVKLGRQEVNLGNQRLVGAVGWSQAGRSLDGILLGYVAGDYGLAGFFYGKLNDEAKGVGPWLTQGVYDKSGNGHDLDIDLYVATWQGNFKPFGIGGTYEITDIYVNPTSRALGVDANINTLYGRVTPAFDTDFAKVKLNLEAATQSGDAGKNDFSGYFFSVGAGADFTDVAWKPGVFIGYDYYSGDSDDDGDIDTFWSVLPTAHKWLGHADVIWTGNLYKFNGAIAERSPGVEDLYLKLHAQPLDRVAVALDLHYFKAAEDYAIGYTVNGNTYNGVVPKTYDKKGTTSDDVGWESDFAVKYKYSKNLCLTLGWDHFDPDSDAKAVFGGDDAEDHLWAQADLKF